MHYSNECQVGCVIVFSTPRIAISLSDAPLRSLGPVMEREEETIRFTGAHLKK